MFFFFLLAEFLSLSLMFRAEGFLATLGLLAFSFLLGVAILQRQGFRVLREFQTGRVDLSQDSVLLARVIKILAALLLMIPGFFSDVLALLLLFPLTRPLLQSVVLAWIGRLKTQGRVVIYGPRPPEPREMRDVTPKEPDLLNGK